VTVRRRRRHRREPDDAIPEAVSAWFAGETSIPWEALLDPDRRTVPTWWQAWKREHPEARPPADAIAGQLEEAPGE